MYRLIRTRRDENTQGASTRRLALIGGFLLVVGVGTSSAQLVVFDAATTARNSTTAVLKELLYNLERLQHDKLRAMARRLSALTSLRKYTLQDVPRWRTHGDDFYYAQPYNDALIFGDPAGTAFGELTQPLVATGALLDRLDPRARRFVEARLGTVNLNDAAAIAGTNGTGLLRFLGRKSELPAIDALERDVVDPSVEQSTVAVLDKISGGVLLGARQRQARIQLLTGVLEQLLVDSKRARDTEAASLDMQLATWRARRVANEMFASGAGDALRSWRQP